MVIRAASGAIVGTFILGTATAAGAANAPAPAPTQGRVVTAQPDTSGGTTEAQPTGANGLPAPAQPKPARKRNFFAGPGLGLLLAGAGGGAAVAASSGDDNNPASP